MTIDPHAALVLVKAIHTLAWALLAGSVLAVPICAARGRIRLAAVFSAIVLCEIAVLALNHMRCPLTDLAARFTSDRSDNFDIYLPLWLARYNKAIFGALFLAGEAALVWAWLQGREPRRALPADDLIPARAASSEGATGIGWKAFRSLPGIARHAVTLEILLGVGALYGGSQFIVAPDGHLLGLKTSMLNGSPFRSYLGPGILLFSFIGVAPMLAAAITLRRRAAAPLAAVAVGLILIGWISAEMVMLAGISSLLWAFYLLLGACITAVGVAWRVQRKAARPARNIPQ